MVKNQIAYETTGCWLALDFFRNLCIGARILRHAPRLCIKLRRARQDERKKTNIKSLMVIPRQARN
jgi:hypothetical protein